MFAFSQIVVAVEVVVAVILEVVDVGICHW